MADALLVCQELVDALAVGPKEVLAISDSYHHGIEFIRVKRKEKTGKVDKIKQVLPESA